MKAFALMDHQGYLLTRNRTIMVIDVKNRGTVTSLTRVGKRDGHASPLPFFFSKEKSPYQVGGCSQRHLPGYSNLPPLKEDTARARWWRCQL